MKDEYENSDIKKKIIKIEKERGIEFIQCVKSKNEQKLNFIILLELEKHNKHIKRRIL